MNVIAIDTIKTVKPTLKRVAGYARVSVDRTPSAESLKTQTAFLKRRIQSTKGWVDCGVFLDLGFTGTRTNRPGFKALMEKCDKGEVDMVLTKSISRFCRNTVDLLSTVRHLKEIGVEVYFDENGISTFSSEGELLLTLLASQAQEESRSISENVLWSIRKRFEQGLGQPKDLLGYRWDGNEYRLIEEEAVLVRMIFNLYHAGFGPQEISNRLNALGVKTILGFPFCYNSVWETLRQEKYTGDSILQKSFAENHITHRRIKNRGERDMFYVEGTHPPIISKELFEDTQREIERRKELGTVGTNWTLNTYMFTSHIKCCKCGRAFRRKSSHRKGYKPYHKWACGERIDKKHGGCEAMAVPEWFLNESVASILGKADYTEEEFHSQIASIKAGWDHEVVFVLTDGSERTMSWKGKRKKYNG